MSDPSGYDENTAPEKLRQLYGLLGPDRGSDYGTILPFAVDRATGKMRAAMPSLIRDGLLGALDLAAGTETGEVTMRGAMALPMAGTALAAKTVPRGSLGMFGGMNAKTADMQALHKALDMEKAGVIPTEIWETTGWGRGPDKKWRFEINDAPAEYRPGALRSEIKENTGASYPELWEKGYQGTLPQVLDHPDLYAAYPELKNTVWQAIPDSQMKPHVGGYQDGNTLAIRMSEGARLDAGKSITLHEIQHRIQDLEGFARGGQTGDAAAMVLARQKPNWRTPEEKAAHIAAEMRSGWKHDSAYIKGLLEEAGPDVAARAHELRQYFGLEELRNRAKDGRLEGYKRLAGETEARNVQHRMNYDAEKRRDLPPAFTQDYHDIEQIVTGPGLTEYNPYLLGDRLGNK